MLDAVVQYLSCPYCGGGLARAGAALRCPAGHAFDVARQGYVSLLPRGVPGDGGDTPAMVQARAAFLAAGHFAGLADAIAAAAADAIHFAGLADAIRPQPADAIHPQPADAIRPQPADAIADPAGVPAPQAGATRHRKEGNPPAGADGCVVDCGAGTGYYLARLLDRLPGRAGIALERSRYALRRAARAHPRAGAVACDVWRGLPVAAGAAALAVNVFAPRNGAELRRILRPGGRLVVVTPDRDHLRELTGTLGLLAVDERKDERLGRELGRYFTAESRREYREIMKLDRPAVLAAALMGPGGWHVSESDLAGRAASLPDPAPVTLSVRLSVFRPA